MSTFPDSAVPLVAHRGKRGRSDPGCTRVLQVACPGSAPLGPQGLPGCVWGASRAEPSFVSMGLDPLPLQPPPSVVLPPGALPSPAPLLPLPHLHFPPTLVCGPSARLVLVDAS